MEGSLTVGLVVINVYHGVDGNRVWELRRQCTYRYWHRSRPAQLCNSTSDGERGARAAPKRVCKIEKYRKKGVSVSPHLIELSRLTTSSSATFYAKYNFFARSFVPRLFFKVFFFAKILYPNSKIVKELI